MKRVATGLFCVFFASACFAACSSTIPVEREKKDSQAVIVGTVVSSRLVPQSWDTLDGTEYVVHIDQKIKGRQTGEITIFSEHKENGVRLESGKQYLLFLTNNYSHWMINTCGNSGPADEAGQAIHQLAHPNNSD